MLKRRVSWPKGTRWLAGGIVAVVMSVAVAWVLFVPAADWLARHDVGSAKGSLHETALDNARGRLLTLGAGLFAAAALIFTARNFTVSRRTLDLSEQGQVTDRYTKAVEQLGSEKLDVRIGGIYALERVARDSPRDHPTVMEVLTTFIRVHSREPWASLDPDSMERDRLARPDVQVAATVVGRRAANRDNRLIDFSYTNLAGADLSRASLSRASLSFANLTRANLTRVNLTHALLTRANLTGAYLADANLTHANLSHANLPDANLPRADLTRTDLRAADLTRGPPRGEPHRREPQTLDRLRRGTPRSLPH
jgi:hypothetical protein